MHRMTWSFRYFSDPERWEMSVQYSVFQQMGAFGSEVNKFVIGLTGGGD
jgi:hypothetical protein